MMKKLLLISAALLLIFGTAKAQSEYSIIDKDKPTESSIEIISENSEGITLKLSLNAYKFSEVQTPNGTEVIVGSPNGINYMEKGLPDIPYFATTIRIPANGKAIAEIVDANYTTLEDISIAPSKGSIKRNVDPSTVPYEYGSCYSTDAFVPTTEAVNSEAFCIRDVRGTNVHFFPFQYNPVQKQLKICTEMTVRINFTQQPSENEVTASYEKIDEFENIYRRLFINYGSKTRYTQLQDGHPGRMLIICKDTYQSAMTDFVNWKREKGLDVEMVLTSTVGSTASNIQSYITNYFNNHSDLAYILLVGDAADVPTNNNGSTWSPAHSDNQYAYLVGNDHYADVFIGRFSGESVANIQNMVRKVIHYEKEITTSDTWLAKAYGSASNEGAGQGHNQGNGAESDMQHMGFIQTDLENYGYTVTRVNQASSGYTSDLAATSSAFNNGVGLGCYIGHGDVTEWASTGYTNTHVNALTNANKYPFIISVACVNGDFNGNTCFAEAWLRASNNGNPTGALAFLGSTINQDWTPPMTAQDEMVDIITESLTNNIKRTIGGISFNGYFRMIQDHTGSNNDGAGMADTWTIFGDPSTMFRSKTPSAITSSNNEMVMGVPYTTTIKIGNTPVQDALVCISQNGSYYRGYTDANGQVSISNDFSVGEALLVVTAYNTTTIYQTIPVNTANEPYISIQNYSPQNVSFGTTNNLSMTLVNMGGVATTGNTTVTLTTSDQYLTLNTASATFGTMAAQGGTASSSSFNFSVAENTPDGHVATINATITNGSYTWNSTMSITIAGPACDAPTGLDVTVNGSSATITWDTQVITPVTISDDFEGHTAFTINSPGTVGWTYIDGDGSTTGAISGYNSWNNANSEMAYIVFDPSQVTSQSGSGNLSSSITAHSGSQFLASFYITSQNTNLQNDDWIVSPELNFAEDFTFSFYCRGGHKSNNNSYTETYEVYYSTTTNDKSAFTNPIESATVTGGNNIQWTYKTYTVPSSAKYVAIKYASTDKYYFCIDDITISGTEITGAGSVNLYDNGVIVASNITTGSYTTNNLTAGEHCFSIRAVCNDNSESMSAQECVNVTSSTPSYTVTVNVGNGGTVNPSGNQTVYQGNNFTFTVTPNDCYEIANVTVNGTAVTLNNNQYTINNITANQTVNVTFSQLSYTITATAGNGGTISPAGTSTVNCGGNITYTISPNNGFMVSDLRIDGQSVGSQTSYTFSDVDANHTINATFEAIPAGEITITVNADAEGGTVSPTGTQTITEGSPFTFTVTPDNCHTIGNVTVNGTAVTLNANNSYTIQNVTAPQTVNVTFNQINYSIAASAGNGGSISPVGSVEVGCGDDMTFTITPNSGYEIANVIVDGQSIGAIASYTFENVTANGHSIYATFAVVETCYTITGLEVSVETYGNVLNWNAAENAVSYNIYRNNDNTILANIATTSYIDLNGNVGDSYRIVTVCQHGESESSESVTATPSGIDENSISVNLYPNPTNGNFMIECNGMSSIEVFNMVGQLVKQIDVNTDKTSIDASTWAKGVYSIRIATADSNIVVKQLIKQ